MPTLYSELTEFCKQTGLPMPPKKDRNLLGHQIAQFFRASRKVFEIPKEPSMETIMVTTYPEDFKGSMQELIKQFFNMPMSELHKLRCMTPAAKKRFKFEVDPNDSAMFEAMLVKKNIKFHRNGMNGKKFQFTIEYVNPCDLIYLGMAFYKNSVKQ